MKSSISPYWLAWILPMIMAITGCKVEAIATQGGNIVSLSGSRDCAESNTCSFTILATPYSESFTAVAKPGYEFVKWHFGDRFLCGGWADPTCEINLADDAAGNSVVALFKTAYIMPEFRFLGLDFDGDGVLDHLDEDDDNDGLLDETDLCPLNVDPECKGTIQDTVTVGARQWAQVDLFRDISWNEIEAVCPKGKCLTGQTLNGYDMSGWWLASTEDLNELFNHYIGAIALPPGPGFYFDSNPQITTHFVDQFFADGWRETTRENGSLCNPCKGIDGWTRSHRGSVFVAYHALLTQDSSSGWLWARTDEEFGKAALARTPELGSTGRANWNDLRTS